jgi:hypothetical protein
MTALAMAVETPTRTPRRSRKLAAVPESGYLPRLAPPLPKRTAIAELRDAARITGRKMYAWQDVAGQYMTATRGGRWLYPEFVLAVARQNGKTSILVPRIVMGLRRGERIMHTAQDRALPRDVFVEVVDIMEREFANDLKGKPRLANGTERIQMLNGGVYRIVAPTRSGARGPTNDLVIVDEAREMGDHDFVAAAQPTLTVSRSPQMIYLSNAGTDESVVLNGLRKRAEVDQTLGYLEWSAHPDRPRDDRTGWQEANPSLADGVNAKGHWEFLERMYDSYMADGHPEIFETEHLCRWVTTELPRVVSAVAWERARQPIGDPVRPALGIAADPAGRQASAVLAWTVDGIVYIHVLTDVTGYPVDLEQAAEATMTTMRRWGVRQVAFDAWTDRDLARYFKDPHPMQGADWEAACERFSRSVEAGLLRYQDDDGALSRDMAHTVRKDTAHGWVAIPSTGEHPVTASLAAIRAVWLATNPAARPPQVY